MTLLDDRAGLAGKVAVVTGGAGGIGWAIARDLLLCGADVALCDRDAEAVSRVSAEAGRVDGRLLARVVDVREADDVGGFFQVVDDRFGGLDLLVNVPGGTFRASFADSNRRGWEALIRANFGYVLDVVHEAIPRMQRRGGGSILNVTSIEAHRAAPSMAVYGAMKAAVESLTRSLALELADDGIRVNTLAPDMVLTEATVAAGWFPEDEDSPAARVTHGIAIPMGRMGTVDEASSCALFLLSGLASYVTGSTLFVDGGSRAASGWWHWPDGYRVKPPPDVVEWLVERGEPWSADDPA